MTSNSKAALPVQADPLDNTASQTQANSTTSSIVLQSNQDSMAIKPAELVPDHNMADAFFGVLLRPGETHVTYQFFTDSKGETREAKSEQRE